VYSGFFSSLPDGELEDINAPTMGCCVQDRGVLGAEAGSSISEVVIRYMGHRMCWFRVWFPMRQEEGEYQCILESRHYKEGRNESVSVAFDESWKPVEAGAADGQPVPPASILERLGAIANHDPEFDAILEEPPGFARRWRGHLSLRPCWPVKSCVLRTELGLRMFPSGRLGSLDTRFMTPSSSPSFRCPVVDPVRVSRLKILSGPSRLARMTSQVGSCSSRTASAQPSAI
jgi:hypothetical protein